MHLYNKTKTASILAERIWFLDNAFKGNKDSEEVVNLLLTQFKEIYAKNPNVISRTEASNLFTHSFARLNDPSAPSTEVAKLIADNIFGDAEKLKGVSAHMTLDLLVFIQRPSKKNTWLRTMLQPLLEERIKECSPNLLDAQKHNSITSDAHWFYIKRLINLEETTPVHTMLGNLQVRNILEFLDKQPNATKISSYLIYRLVEKIIHHIINMYSHNYHIYMRIHDLKYQAKNVSKNFEKYRTDQMISGILNKIQKEDAHITVSFIDSLVHSANTLFEMPSFYQRAVRNFLNNGLVEPTADQKHRLFDQDRLFVALAAHRLYDGTISNAMSQKIIEWVKGGEKHFSVKRLQKDFGVSADGASTPMVEATNYDTMAVRGARILHKLQQRNGDAFKDHPEQVISNDVMKQIAENVMQRAQKQAEQGRYKRFDKLVHEL